jgi:hypothetical protein
MKIDFLKSRAREIATFMDKFIKEKSIPKASADRSQGGVVLAGWSMGNVQGLAVLGLARFLPDELVHSLEPYLKSYIMYGTLYLPSLLTQACLTLNPECPSHGLGFPNPPNSYHPVRDPNIPPERKTAAFTTWVSGYFKHPGLLSCDYTSLECVHPSPHRRSTWSVWSPEEIAQITDSRAGPRSEDPFFMSSLDMMRRIKADVFYPPEVVWPKVDIKLIWTEETVWNILYGMYLLRKELQMWKGKYPEAWMRSLTVASLPEANHFVSSMLLYFIDADLILGCVLQAHWDEPEKLMDIFFKFVTT